MRKALLVALVLLLAFVSGCSRLDSMMTVSNKRFGEVPRDVREFVTPASVKKYATIEEAWRALEHGYCYAVDKWFLTDATGQHISGGKDTWLMPVETQYLLDTYPDSHSMDCEDGAAWLASVLKKQGYDAWLCVGTIDIDGTLYGHAWCMVLCNGEWTTYETTANEVKVGLPAIYSIAWRTNGSATWKNLFVGAPKYTELTEQMPASMLARLKEVLGSL